MNDLQTFECGGVSENKIYDNNSLNQSFHDAELKYKKV